MARFAIVVPTRNRPDALRMTLLGLSATTHEAIEIIVSDNSDVDVVVRNQEIVANALNGMAHRYVRPPRVLNMVEHWNFAVEQAPEADYVGFVTDRMTLLPQTVAICNQIAERTGTASICFLNGVVSPKNGIDLPALPTEVQAVETFSANVLADFARVKMRKDSPRFLNSFTSRKALEAIKSIYGQVFGGIAPDYAFTFRFLSLSASYHVIFAPMLIDHSPHISNGMAFSRNIRNAATQDYLRKLKLEQAAVMAVGPLPNDTTILPGAILRELEICRSVIGSSGSLPQIEPIAFYLACGKSIRISSRYFDLNSRETAARIETFRVKHGLSKWGIKFRIRIHALILRNTIRHVAALIVGRKLILPGVSRDSRGDQALLTNLRSLVVKLTGV